MINISLVSYSNTLPFRYALENSESINEKLNLSFCYPAECYISILKNKTDISLVPVATLNLLNDVRIFSDYCISAYDKVESVLLLSKVPLSDVKEIILDYQSKTSVAMVKIFSRFFWNKNFSFFDAKPGFENCINDKTAAVVIGDRAIKLRNNYPFLIDFAAEWRKFTGLPAVFAVWVARNYIDYSITNHLNDLFAIAINNIDKVSEEYQTDYSQFNLKHYLKNCIDYRFDKEKHKSLEIFLDYLSKL